MTWKRACFSRAAAAAVLAAALWSPADNAPAASRCDREVCIEIGLPPHVREVAPGTKIECIVVLPRVATVRTEVQVFLSADPTARKGCLSSRDTILEGTSWKRTTIDLAALKPGPGTYTVGVALVGGQPKPSDGCPERRFLSARRIVVKPGP